VTEAWEPWVWRTPINASHPRYADLLALVSLHNARQMQVVYLFDPEKPLSFGLSPMSNHYWSLRGTSVVGEPLRREWVQAHDNGRTDFRADLDRILGIEATLDPETALGRVLDAERRRADRLKEQNP